MDKRYEEALERAKAGKPLDEVFPELKESEDERIRKAIESTIRVYGKTQGEWIAGYDMDTLVIHLREAFNALEKQKEQDVKVISWREPDDCADIPEGHYVVIAYKPGVFGLGYIGKGKVLCAPGQKPSGILYIPNADESIIVESKEQKPVEWSEEDERMVEIAEECATNKDFVFETLEKQLSFLDWLKSLPERFNLQPKQEWSEEDEKHINSILERLEGMCKKGATFTPTRFAVSEDEDWLKSLRPQPYWKPSEEQMDILDKVYHYLWADRNATADMQDGLGDFIDELKSL